MSWDTDLGSMSPFPLFKLHIKFLSLGKRHFRAILGGCMIFSFDCRITLTLGENSNFKLLKLKKITKETNSENLKTVPLAVSSILHV